ncbi:uncharacterized protein N7482_001768 [Penicillium canariense]|uniref:Uncharacterized protein n=1 Tax=Penicillium canariense TaxID=189055 RepID=A0A9W9IHT0_9EURO|nr:uncharacterized protein N7482_001768 [Penicillium canariense]KAJ5175891.1 hypothetical protein N7482_001768 [Penicillium canariense]
MAIHRESSLRDAVVSVGLAAMSNVTQDRALSLAAREKYVATINVVQRAVENPESANVNQTFKIILMLSLYEMVCCTPNRIDSWIVHLDGVAALAKQTSFEDAMKSDHPRPQLQFYFILIVRYFLTQGEIPSDLLDWSPGCVPSVKPDVAPAVRLVGILIRFMKLHSSIQHHRNPDPETTAGSAQACDAELENWENQLPRKWMFSLNESTDLHNTFKGKYLLYNDMWASRILNHYFWARLMVNEMIALYLSRLETPTLYDLQRRQRALDTISRMATYICAGAASQMGVFACRLPLGGLKHLPPLNGVFMLMFPLAVAGGAAGAPKEVHEWVLETLQRIGETMGIRRALETIPMLNQARERKMKELTTGK